MILKNLLLQNHFSRTTWPISIKLVTNHPWLKGILDYSKKGSRPIPRGDDYEIVKMNWQNLLIKVFFSRTTRPISAKLSKKHPWVKSLFKWKGHTFLHKEIITKLQKYIQFKNLLLNYCASFIIYIIITSLKCIHWF